MGFCYLPPDRVKLTEQQERNKGQGQIGPKGVKLGQAHFDRESIGPRCQDGSEHSCCVYFFE